MWLQFTEPEKRDRAKGLKPAQKQLAFGCTCVWEHVVGMCTCVCMDMFIYMQRKGLKVAIMLVVATFRN